MSDGRLVIPFAEIGAGEFAQVGGKAANLGVLSAASLPVPGGFCLTTVAYRLFVGSVPEFPRLVAELEAISADDIEAVRRLGAEMRDRLCSTPMAAAIEAALLAAWRELGEQGAYAVRSSATAEDLPGASFAGQQDTYLNIIGEAALVDRVRACFASLYTDRAILYRRKNGIPHGETALAVVVQQMVQPAKSGILFTADPLSGHRRQIVIDAGFGLGEALVSGLINADLYRVDRRSGELIECTIGDKHLAIDSLASGGTEQRSLSAEERAQRVLDDHELAGLVALGERIEATYGGVPQDIEWCITPEGEFFVVQSRPITTLYPLMEPRPSGHDLEVGLSIGHLQMMTEAMKPLGLSTVKQILPVGRRMDEPGECPWLRVAGSRLYIEVGRMLRFGPARRALLAVAPSVEPLGAKALKNIVMRPGFVDSGPRTSARYIARFARFMSGNVMAWIALRSPEGCIERINRHLDRELAGIDARIAAGEGLAGRLRSSVRELQLTLHKIISIMPAMVAGLLAGKVLRKTCPGYETQITALGRGLQGNVTTSMDLEVGDLADCARRHPEVRAALQGGLLDLDALAQLPGGAEFKAAVDGFLHRYGMRGPGEFDLTNPRWEDKPASLLSMIAGNLGHETAGAHRAHHGRLAVEAEKAAAELSMLSWGPKRALIRRMVRLHRILPAVREHPKYFLVRVMAKVRQQVLLAGQELVSQGRIDRPEQVFFLEYDELIAAVEDAKFELRTRIDARTEEYERDRQRTPPRVMTSEGEIPRVSHSGDVPAGALAGSGVSAGIVEGIVRVITDPVGQVLGKGEILVAPYTDPGWTPLFINAAGVVIEVGGMMTHGSVVAREYGIPAVVSVPEATTLLRTGQRIRVNGDEGWAMVIDDEPGEAVD